ncbi:MAG: DNA replication/repair protein RecF [Magnetococcales bacterium]|nr:DNA replication/repair protein RecF [Magnetococcales bacterium]
MRLVSLELRHFRNIDQASLNFGSRLVLVTGENGQGKSNLLEAIGLLASGRSFRRAPPEVMRGHGQPFFALDARVLSGELQHRLEFFGKGPRLAARLDGKAMAATSAMGATLAAVVVTPETLDLVQGGPGERRRHLDRLAFLRKASHAALARQYQQALQARNRLLTSRQGGDAVMEAWEERLAVLGGTVTLARRSALSHLERHLTPCLEAMALAGRRYEVRLGCQLDREEGDWSTPEEAVSRYRELLVRHREADRRQGETRVGPHRDDLLFLMDGKALARFGSQGQQKRLVLALKLAEADLLREVLGETPLFLLDDPVAELDRAGLERFMALLAEREPQIFVTTCSTADIPWGGGEKNVFTVSSGHFRERGE